MNAEERKVNPRRAIKSARSALRKIASARMGTVYARGFHFLETQLRALRALGAVASREADRRLIAEGWFKIATTYEFNNAPRAAIRAYLMSERAFASAGAPREAGTCQAELGQVGAATRSLRRALRIDPNDVYARQELDNLRRGLTGIAYDSRDVVWAAAEELARGRPNVAIRRLYGFRGATIRQWRGCAYALLGNFDAYLREWQLIADLNGDVVPTNAMWFYLPKEAEKSPELWKLFLRISERMVGGYVPCESELRSRSLLLETPMRARRAFFRSRLGESRRKSRGYGKCVPGVH